MVVVMVALERQETHHDDPCLLGGKNRIVLTGGSSLLPHHLTLIEYMCVSVDGLISNRIFIKTM